MRPALASALTSLSRLVRWDRPTRMVLAVFGATLLLMIRGRYSPDGFAAAIAAYADPLLLTATVVVLLHGRRARERRERRFWDLVALAWLCWLLIEAFYFFGLSLPLISASFATDALHVLFYLVFALAIDQRPDIAPARPLTMLRRRLESGAGLVAFFGVLVYFALTVTPEPLDLSLSFVSREQGLTPLLLLRLSLDVLILVRLTNVALRARGSWPPRYALLALGLLLLAARDLLTLLRYTGLLAPATLAVGGDLLHGLPGLLMVLAARLAAAQQLRGNADPQEGEEPRGEEREVLLPNLLAGYTLVVPVAHFLLYPSGLLEEASRSAREVFALGYLLVAGSIAAVHQLVLDRERRQAITSLHREIEERKRVHRELELRHAEMEQFNYTISHELQTPLVTIGGFVGLAESGLESDDTDQLARDLERIRVAAEHMRRVLQELLELSRVGWHVEPEAGLSMDQVVAEAQQRLEVKIASRRPVISVETELPTVHADRARMVDVLTNLIENAVKFTPLKQSPEVRIGYREGDPPVFYVADNGRGIQPHFHDRVFGLFDRLDPSIEGTGVGLALVKRIIEEHGGRVWVESEGAGLGATFCFTLGEPVLHGSGLQAR